MTDTMKNISKIQSVLLNMATLLRSCGQNNWAYILDRINSEMEEEPLSTISKILSIFGGVGSFGDVILYRDGQPLIAENDELYHLRTALYALCHE
jgi:hypothetical protein